LTRVAFSERYARIEQPKIAFRRWMWNFCRMCLDPPGLEVVRRKEFDLRSKEEGVDWPGETETMIRLKRLDSLKACVTKVLQIHTKCTDAPVTEPGFCTSCTERVYITAIGCELCFGTRGLQAARAGGP